eukprot:5047520-Pyramimonas_sp.AAC.1
MAYFYQKELPIPKLPGMDYRDPRVRAPCLTAPWFHPFSQLANRSRAEDTGCGMSKASRACSMRGKPLASPTKLGSAQRCRAFGQPVCSSGRRLTLGRTHQPESPSAFKSPYFNRPQIPQTNQAKPAEPRQAWGSSQQGDERQEDPRFNRDLNSSAPASSHQLKPDFSASAPAPS